jgi:4-hydroxy-tetrahydrodipicolinate reductase
MKPLRISVVGSRGKMGQELLKLIRELPNSYRLVNEIHRNEKLKSDGCDVVIDFSSPQFSLKTVQSTKASAYVIGTTGFSVNEMLTLKKLSKKKVIFYSPNMSIGVAVLKKALKSLEGLHDFDIQILDFHHRNKKDNPSGTALMLKNALPKGLRVAPPIGVRGGGIFGVHHVIAMSDSEVLDFSHTALNRTVFAKGALQVAQWIYGKKPGKLYSFEDFV